MQRAGIRKKSVPVFLLLKDLIQGNEDGRTAAAYRVIAEEFGLSASEVYRAINELVKFKWLEADIRSRRYKMLKLGPGYRKAVDEADFEAQNEAENYSKNRSEIIDHEAENEAEIKATGVSRLRRSSPDVVVSRSGVTEDLKHRVAATALATSPPSPPPEPYTIETFRRDYNEKCPRLHGCREINASRENKFRIEKKKHGDRSYWLSVLDAANRSDWMAGDNERGWISDID